MKDGHTLENIPIERVIDEVPSVFVIWYKPEVGAEYGHVSPKVRINQMRCIPFEDWVRRYVVIIRTVTITVG